MFNRLDLQILKVEIDKIKVKNYDLTTESTQLKMDRTKNKDKIKTLEQQIEKDADENEKKFKKLKKEMQEKIDQLTYQNKEMMDGRFAEFMVDAKREKRGDGHVVMASWAEDAIKQMKENNDDLEEQIERLTEQDKSMSFEDSSFPTWLAIIIDLS